MCSHQPSCSSDGDFTRQICLSFLGDFCVQNLTVFVLTRKMSYIPSRHLYKTSLFLVELNHPPLPDKWNDKQKFLFQTVFIDCTKIGVPLQIKKWYFKCKQSTGISRQPLGLALSEGCIGARQVGSLCRHRNGPHQRSPKLWWVVQYGGWREGRRHRHRRWGPNGIVFLAASWAMEDSCHVTQFTSFRKNVFP